MLDLVGGIPTDEARALENLRGSSSVKKILANVVPAHSWLRVMQQSQQRYLFLRDRTGATTVIRAYGVLAAVLDTAVRDRRLLSNPARGVKLPRKTRSEHRYLSHAEVMRLASSSGSLSTLVYVLAYTGMRWGEAIGLRVRDIDMQRHRIKISQPRDQRWR